MKLKKLDKRNSGYGTWLYYVDRSFLPGKKHEFIEWREWCWDTWGASKEINEFDTNDLFDGERCSNNNWCWQKDQYRERIFLKTEEAAVLFALRWL